MMSYELNNFYTGNAGSSPAGCSNMDFSTGAKEAKRMKGMMFIEELFHAVVSGEKTQTRRITRKFNVGDKVFLQEPYLVVSYTPFVYYKFDMANDTFRDTIRWKNKMFMPEKDSRYHILIESVKEEHLQDISEQDAIDEGIKWKWNGVLQTNLFKDYLATPSDLWVLCPIESYKSLWEKINGKGSWDMNPKVYAYTFKLIANANTLILNV